MTPLYDVLSAQPSLDAHRIQRKKLKLAMSVGKNPHDSFGDVVPRHFEQTAHIAGIGAPLALSLFADLAANVPRHASAVIAAVPDGFPQDIIDSIAGGIADRIRLIENYLSGGPAADGT